MFRPALVGLVMPVDSAISSDGRGWMLVPVLA